MPRRLLVHWLELGHQIAAEVQLRSLAVLRREVGAGKVPLQAPGDLAGGAALPAAAVARAPLHAWLLYLQRNAAPAASGRLISVPSPPSGTPCGGASSRGNPCFQTKVGNLSQTSFWCEQNQ